MSDETSSPRGSKPSSRSSSPSVVLPEALAFGREKRATAGNKLRALLDAEFQEEEIFKEDEDDEEFERQKSDEEEVYLSESSESDSDEEAEDEEAGEKQLLAQQKAEATQARKRKADKSYAKPPVAKRRIPTELKATTTGILASKPTSTTSSVSNRRISFDPALLVSRRSSRALTVQTTNETQSRIISAAARRATLPVVPRREQTPPLTQEERLAQAVLTEQENKMSLMRIVEAEEERARKRKEKLEALRRRHFNEPIIRFISRRRSLIEEIPDGDGEVEEDVIVDDDKQESVGAPEVKTEGVDAMVVEESKDVDDNSNGSNGEEKNMESEKMDIDQNPEENASKDGALESTLEKTDVKASPQHIQCESEAPEDVKLPTSARSASESERMDANEATVATEDAMMEKTSQDVVNAQSPHTPASATDECKNTERENGDDGIEQSPITKDDSKLTETNSTEPPQPVVPTDEISATEKNSPSTSVAPPEPLRAKTPPPYHEAYFTSNTVSILPLPSQPLQSTRNTFFPSIPLVPPPKPKPCARCPITGLVARYKDPLSGVGYYDIHAFKILREVGRKGSRYVWCSEGGWFVGELGWGGRGAKGVPEGWAA